MSRSGLAIAGLVVSASIAFASAPACGNDYSESSGQTTTSDAGSEGSPDAAQEDAGTLVKCAQSTCSTACCIVKGAAPKCCGDNRTGQDVVLECAVAANCASGQICCLHKGTSQTTSECATSEACTGGGGVRMCDGNALATGCASGQSCSEGVAQTIYDLPAGYGVCITPGGGG